VRALGTLVHQPHQLAVKIVDLSAPIRDVHGLFASCSRFPSLVRFAEYDIRINQICHHERSEGSAFVWQGKKQIPRAKTRRS
jgi:hypothetical protein